MRYQLNLPIEYDQARRGFFFDGEVGQFPTVHITEAELVARKALEQYADTPFQKPLAAAFQKFGAGLENEIAFNWQDLERTFAFRPIALANAILLPSKLSPQRSGSSASWSLTTESSRQKKPSAFAQRKDQTGEPL